MLIQVLLRAVHKEICKVKTPTLFLRLFSSQVLLAVITLFLQTLKQKQKQKTSETACEETKIWYKFPQNSQIENV